MKKPPLILASAIICLGLFPAYSQFGGGPHASPMRGHLAKLFGANSAFSASLETQTKNASTGDIMTMSGKVFFAEGKSRSEMDMTPVKGGPRQPEAIAQKKSMGMDNMIMVVRPDKKATYLIYPGMQSYVETTLPDAEAATATNDFKIETTALGRETVDGHPCVKNKVVVTDDQGNKHESTVWNATDLKKFPVKIEQIEKGNVITILYKNVNFSQPDAGLFEPPSDYTRYDSIQTMMRQEMMKRMGGGGADGFLPPRQ
jgi:hypothetical protein